MISCLVMTKRRRRWACKRTQSCARLYRLDEGAPKDELPVQVRLSVYCTKYTASSTLKVTLFRSILSLNARFSVKKVGERGRKKGEEERSLLNVSVPYKLAESQLFQRVDDRDQIHRLY